jgi:hypothetical protein
MSLVLWLSVPMALLAAAPAKPPPADATLCEVILAKHVKNLALIDGYGNAAVYMSRGSSLLLAPGEYKIREISLEGGYSSSIDAGRAEQRVTLTSGKPYHFDVGPLKSGVTVKRAGRLLTMDYQLLDAAGRQYRNLGRTIDSKPPQFTVYQGDRAIGSGTFEYG